MNENIDLTKILKNCPRGTTFWSDNYGEVKFLYIDERLDEPIVTKRTDGYTSSYTKEGWLSIMFPASCLLWPSKDCRDWSKFNVRKSKFDPKTLNPFDKVLVSDDDGDIWQCSIFAYILENEFPYICFETRWKRCIPYNDDTKHLVGTKEEAPEFYRYWED